MGTGVGRSGRRAARGGAGHVAGGPRAATRGAGSGGAARRTAAGGSGGLRPSPVGSQLGADSAGRPQEALAPANLAIEVAPDPSSQAMAISMRGLAHAFNGEFAEGVRDSAASTEIARSLSPAMLCGSLMLEAQARQFAGELDRAIELLDEAQRAENRSTRRSSGVGTQCSAISPRSRTARSRRSSTTPIRSKRPSCDATTPRSCSTCSGSPMRSAWSAPTSLQEVSAMGAKLVQELGGPEASQSHLVGQEALFAARAAPRPGRDGRVLRARARGGAGPASLARL